MDLKQIEALKKENITADESLYDAGWNGAINEVLKTLKAGQHETIVIDKLSDEFGYEVHGLDESLTDEEWNDKLYSHANWLKDHVESVAEKLLNDNLR